MQEYERLEKEWAEFNSVEPDNMVVCSSGTAALHLAFEVLQEFFRIRKSEVVCPDFAMVACPRAIEMADLTPRFVDVDFSTRVVKEKQNLNYAYTNLLVHTYGRVSPFIRYNDGPVVEDLSEAHGVKPYDETDAACWSFYKNKIVGGEEGGAVYFKDKAAAQHARRLRCLGMGSNHNFQVVPRGHNYRLSNCHASLILDSLNKFETNWSKRSLLWETYNTRIETTSIDAPWVFDFLLPRYLTPEFVVGYFNKKGIAARYGFYPNHRQQEWYNSKREDKFPATDQLYQSLIYFPIDPSMEIEDVTKICDLYEELLN